MIVIEPSYTILSPDPFNGRQMLQLIELAGRTCYKSEDRITENSAGKFVEMIRKRGHESVLEHGVITVRFVFDRGVSRTSWCGTGSPPSPRNRLGTATTARGARSPSSDLLSGRVTRASASERSGYTR